MGGQMLPPRIANGTLDATGAATLSIFCNGMSWGIEHTRVSSTSTKQTTADLTLSGRPFEATYSGNSDQTDTYYVLDPGDYVTCTWSGGTPGARVTLAISGWQYPPGQAPAGR